jgi:hypothetical protein
MIRHWFNSPALYTLLAQLFGPGAWLHFRGDNVMAALLSMGSGLLCVLVGICYAIMQRDPTGLSETPKVERERAAKATRP